MPLKISDNIIDDLYGMYCKAQAMYEDGGRGDWFDADDVMKELGGEIALLIEQNRGAEYAQRMQEEALFDYRFDEMSWDLYRERDNSGTKFYHIVFSDGLVVSMERFFGHFGVTGETRPDWQEADDLLDRCTRIENHVVLHEAMEAYKRTVQARLDSTR